MTDESKDAALRACALSNLGELRTEVGTVLRQLALTMHRADALPPTDYSEKPTAADWRGRAEWLAAVLTKTMARLEDEHLAALRACAEAPATMTEDFNGTQPVKENPPVPLTAACFDCGLDYSAFGMDMLLPRWQWLMIHPSDGGLLCAGCIVKRAANIPGTVALHAVIGIAPPKEPK